MKIISLILTILFVSCSLGHAQNFSITSNDISHGQKLADKHVFNGFGCNGKNISPQISWKNAPAATKSFALTVYDPDAPTGSGWWHWIVVNIPVKYTSLPTGFGEKNQFKLENNITQVRNDFGIFGFGGSCPPKGDKAHRYIFTIYALKTDRIDLQEPATAALAGFLIHQNILAEVSFMAYYGR